MGSGTSVSQSQLQPGDLVFYYSPVSHVGMYIGNGQIVHAANPSSGVTTAPVNSMPYSGAVRPG
jgi:cell wall-associated NlpC family hydrolase